MADTYRILSIISNILRAFLLRMKFSETETEELVGKVKEKKMGILFENVIPFDIEEERRKTREQREKTVKAEEKGIRACVELCQELGESREKTAQRLQEKFELGEKEASEKVKCYWR